MNEPANLDIARRVSRATFCMTPTATLIFSHCEEIRRSFTIGLIVGNPGVGKTTALRAYARAHAGTMIVSLSPPFGTQAGLVSKLFEAFKCGYGDSFLSRYKEICEEIRSSGVELLIVDEAQFAEKPALNLLHGLYQDFDLPIVLSGNDDLRGSRYRVTFSGNAAIGSRLGHRLDLPSSTPGDVSALCTHRSIQNADCVARLIEYAHRNGGLRSACRAIDGAARLAGSEKQVTVRHIEDAIRFVGV